jgi:hypothetical protein
MLKLFGAACFSVKEIAELKSFRNRKTLPKFEERF